jgi:tetratricopeptide (TPR) repeat protein
LPTFGFMIITPKQLSPFKIHSRSFLKSILILSFFGNVVSAFSQNNTLDSLQTYAKKDTIRVNLLNAAGNKMVVSDIEKALQLYKESELLADALHFKKGKAYSLLYTGRAQISQGDYSGSLDPIQDALAVYEDLKDKEGISTCYLNIGRAYHYLNDFPKALENYKRAAAISEETSKAKILSNALMVIGMIYSVQGDYDKSLEYYKKAIQIDEKSGNKKNLSATLINLGNQYKQQANYTPALEAYNKSLDLKKQLGDEYGVASNLNNIGTLYQEMGNDKAALPYYKKALPILEKLKKSQDILGCLSNIGIILTNQKNPKALVIFKKALQISRQSNDDYNSALFTTNIANFYASDNNQEESLRYFEKAAKMYKQLGAQRELCNNYYNMARIYYIKKEYEKALKLAKAGHQIAKKMDMLSDQNDFSLLLSQIYYSIKEYKLAYESGQTHKALSDSIYKKENFDKLAQIKYKYAYKDTLNSANKNVNVLKKTVQTIDTQRKWLIIGFIGLVIVLGFVTVLLKVRRVKMQNQQLLLEQKLLITQMNPHFIFNSISNIQQLIYEEKDDDAINYLNKFSILTRQILENSNQNYISLSEELEMIGNYLSIQQLLYSGKFRFTITVEEAIDAESIFLPPMLTQPFIENAIKHGLAGKDENGMIDIRFYLKEQKLFFEVLDNGSGFDTSKTTKNHKSLAMTITKERLVNYTKNQDFVVQTDNITDTDEKIIGARVIFEIPYIYEN